jgi:hypothetical protein
MPADPLHHPDMYCIWERVLESNRIFQRIPAPQWFGSPYVHKLALPARLNQPGFE